VPLEGPVLQQGELLMVCAGISERDLKMFGGARQIFGGAVPPLAPPSSAPVKETIELGNRSYERKQLLKQC